MQDDRIDVVVAGHICLDIIPKISGQPGEQQNFLIPGHLINVDSAILSTGGAVSNTGIALHKLGAKVSLMGKIGQDHLGRIIMDVLQEIDPGLAKGMIVTEGEHSSYTVVISPPGVDRTFLHHTGTNDTFDHHDVNEALLNQARLFHFGYPPLMRKMYVNNGDSLMHLFRKVKERGITTSLDLAKPDPKSEAGQANWQHILSRTLPYVDIFLPSLEEILYMLDREKYDQLESLHGTEFLHAVDGELLDWLAEKLLKLGTAVVAIKLGEHGLYMRTSADWERLQAMSACAPQSQQWVDRELLTSSYKVQVVGTTGAGDCTIAGFLAGLLRGLTPHEVLKSAVATGGFNVEHADATSGIPNWSTIEQRIASGWELRPQQLQLANWTWDEIHMVFQGPHDSKRDS